MYGNQRFEEQLGYTTAQLQAMKVKATAAFVHPEDLPRVRAQYRRFDTTAEGEVLDWEFRLLHADGTHRWFHVRATVFDWTDDGSARRIIGHSRDITAQKQTEAALKRFNEDLEKCVVEQTAKLMETNADLLLERNSGRSSKSNSASRKRWKPSAPSPAVSPTTLTISWESFSATRWLLHANGN